MNMINTPGQAYECTDPKCAYALPHLHVRNPALDLSIPLPQDLQAEAYKAAFFGENTAAQPQPPVSAAQPPPVLMTASEVNERKANKYASEWADTVAQKPYQPYTTYNPHGACAVALDAAELEIGQYQRDLRWASARESAVHKLLGETNKRLAESTDENDKLRMEANDWKTESSALSFEVKLKQNEIDTLRKELVEAHDDIEIVFTALETEQREAQSWKDAYNVFIGSP